MPIVRRRYNGNFTVIPNHILSDRRLGAETLGVLVYLLGKPPEWSVYATELGDRFDCGKDKIYRILSELVEIGYIIREQSREAGLFGQVEYVVYDDPPHPEKPEAVKPDTENPPLVKTDLKKELTSSNLSPISSDIMVPKMVKPSTNKAPYTQEFENFWRTYPSKINNSKPKAFEEWRRLSPEDQVMAASSLPAFSEYCRKNKDYHVIHCERYLKYRRFEAWHQQPKPAPKYFSV